MPRLPLSRGRGKWCPKASKYLGRRSVQQPCRRAAPMAKVDEHPIPSHPIPRCVSVQYVPPRAGVAGLAGSKEARASTGASCLGRLGAPRFIVFVFAWCAARLAKPALPTAAHPEGEPVLLVCLSCLLSSSPALRAPCTSSAVLGARGLWSVLPRYCIVRLRRWGCCCPRPRCWASAARLAGRPARPKRARPRPTLSSLYHPCVALVSPPDASSPAQAQGRPCPCSSGRQQLLEQVW